MFNVKFMHLMYYTILFVFLNRKMEYLLALPISESSTQLSIEETLRILEYFKNLNICIKKYEIYCIFKKIL